MISPKVKKILMVGAKVVILLLLIAVVAKKLVQKTEDINLVETFLEQLNETGWTSLLIVVLLMPVNWGLEAFKWRFMITSFQQDYAYWDSLRSILCGVTLGFITPNKIGEFAGRLIAIEKEYWAKGLTAGFWGGVAQFLVTYSLGAVFGIHSVHRWLKDYVDIPYLLLLLAVLATIFTTLWLLFNLPRVLNWIEAWPWLERFTKGISFTFHLPRTTLLGVVGITLARYLIYSHQYVFMFWFYGMDIPYSIIFPAVCTMLVLHTIIPSLPILALGVKGGVLAWLLVPHHTENLIGVMCVIASIWIINLMIPALLGYIQILRTGNRPSLSDLQRHPQAQ